MSKKNKSVLIVTSGYMNNIRTGVFKELQRDIKYLNLKKQNNENFFFNIINKNSIHLFSESQL